MRITILLFPQALVTVADVSTYMHAKDELLSEIKTAFSVSIPVLAGELNSGVVEPMSMLTKVDEDMIGNGIAQVPIYLDMENGQKNSQELVAEMLCSSWSTGLFI